MFSNKNDASLPESEVVAGRAKGITERTVAAAGEVVLVGTAPARRLAIPLPFSL